MRNLSACQKVKLLAQSSRAGLGSRPMFSWLRWAKASRPSGLSTGSMMNTAFSSTSRVAASLRVVRCSSSLSNPSAPESSKPWIEPPYQAITGCAALSAAASSAVVARGSASRSAVR